jgi:hypothetical protein
MKFPSQILPVIPLLAFLLPSHAATHAVLPGASIQAKINIAAAGDIIAIFGGTYNEDITIDKAIRLVEVSGQQVIINGHIAFTNITDCPPFEGFTAGSAGRGITVSNTTGLVFRNLDARNGPGITTNGASGLIIADSMISNLYPNGGNMEIYRSSLTGGINQTSGVLHTSATTIAGNFDTQTAAQKTVAFRTKVSGDCIWRSKRNWFGYSEARSFNFWDQNEAKVVVIGNTIDRQGGEANGINVSVTNSNIFISNNHVVGVAYNANWDYYGRRYGPDNENAIDIRGVGNTSFISNNFCKLEYRGTDAGVRGDGIYVRDSTQATIINNLIVGAKHGISAPFGAVAQNNLYWASPWNAREANGVLAQETLYADPLFVENEAPALQPGSPCIHAGTVDPRFNNRDGSRNTIGPSGGPWLDPDGWTTENPVVISFDLEPDVLLEGVDTEVILSEGQAVSAP